MKLSQIIKMILVILKKKMSDNLNNNKYDRYDRDYYYCDKRYERKVSSIIISLNCEWLR
jgi:hypothetical protein